MVRESKPEFRRGYHYEVSWVLGYIHSMSRFRDGGLKVPGVSDSCLGLD